MHENCLTCIVHTFPSVTCLLFSESVEISRKELLHGDLPTVVLDATGNKAAMQNCFEYVAIVYVGLFTGDITFHDPLFHRKEITLKASRNAVATDFYQAHSPVESGTDPYGWLHHAPITFSNDSGNVCPSLFTGRTGY